MTLPSQDQQELDQTCTGTAANGVLTFTFPPVPQSLAWTGSISFCPTLMTLAHPQKSFYWDTLGQATWVLFRNGVPWVAWKGWQQITNLRATSSDVISIGAYLPGSSLEPLLDTFQARWVGQSVPMQASDFDWPSVSGPSSVPTPVYPANQVVVPGGQNNFFQTLAYPVPSSVLVADADNRLTSPVSAGSQTLIAALPDPAYLWALSLHASVGSLSTVSGAQSWRVQVAGTSSGTIYAVINLDSIPGTTTADAIVLPMYGTPIAGGDGLTVSWAAFGGSVAAFSATAVYDLNVGGNPG